MRNEKRLQIHNLFAHLGNLGGQGVVFRAEELNFGLQVGKPLFFSLPTFKSSNTTKMLALRATAESYQKAM